MKNMAALWIWLMVMAAAFCCAEEGGTGIITGRWVTPHTGPIAEAKVSLFNERTGPPPSPGRSWRAADETTSTDASGRFTLEVPAGNYYLGMTKHRQGGSRPGPPQEGELHHFGRNEKGLPRLFTVLPGRTTDIGVVADAAPYRKGSGNATTAIEGAITDQAGKPAAGVLVFAYSSPEMTGKPLYISERSGSDGKYVLFVEPGEYYLKIRDNYGGGQPLPGEMMGGYGEQSAPAPVSVAAGAITKGIDIRGRRFTGRGRKP